MDTLKSIYSVKNTVCNNRAYSLIDGRHCYGIASNTISKHTELNFKESKTFSPEDNFYRNIYIAHYMVLTMMSDITD